MGKHFDSLVDLVRKESKQIERIENRIPEMAGKPSLVEILRDFMKKGALFDFDLPQLPNYLPMPENEKRSSKEYMADFFAVCKEHGSLVKTPFPVTFIEDYRGVACLSDLGGDKYLLFTYVDVNEAPKNDEKDLSEVSGIMGAAYAPATRDKDIEGWQFTPILGAHISKTGRFYSALPKQEDALRSDLWETFVGYLWETAYIMDPSNFIIERESSQSRKMREEARTAKKKKKRVLDGMLKKTVLRPHYVAASEEDTKQFFREQSDEPRAPHPVRGHFRTYKSDRYKLMRGKTRYIPQYFTGKGKFTGQNGFHYEVLLKKDFDKLVPYSKQ